MVVTSWSSDFVWIIFGIIMESSRNIPFDQDLEKIKMEPAIIAAIIGATVSFATLAFGYTQWRRDVKLKLGQIREEVSLELVRQRIDPYAEFMCKLEELSSLHLDGLREDPVKVQTAQKILQEAVYGKIGLLASHNTRQVLLFVRIGCEQFIEGKIEKDELVARLWALHFALRSDLGIRQPAWPNEVERVHKEAAKDEDRAFQTLITSYDWSKVDLASRNPNERVAQARSQN